MFKNSYMLLYVHDTRVSAEFYGRLLGSKPVQASPNFAAVTQDSGFTLALWSRSAATPPVDASGSSGELIVFVDEQGEVDRTCEDWRRQGVTIVQEPGELVFGRTFTATDPDGHRIRVIAPNEAGRGQ